MNNPQDYAVVSSICKAAKEANQGIVAKYVGDKNVMQALTKLKVDYGQGYYISKPEALV